MIFINSTGAFAIKALAGPIAYRTCISFVSAFSAAFIAVSKRKANVAIIIIFRTGNE